MPLASHPHPWRALRDLDHVRVGWQPLTGRRRAMTDGVQRIWMDTRLTQAERRTALAHELVHIEHGHEGCQDARTEVWVHQEAARWLIPLESLVDALLWARNEGEIADELWVTPDLVAARFDGLAAAEQDEISAAIARKEPDWC